MTGDELGTRSRDDVLAAVYREGGRRRRRRQAAWLAGAAAALALAVAVPLVALVGGDDGASVVADGGTDDDSTTSTRRATSTTDAVVPGTVTTLPVPSTVTPATVPAPPTTADPCRNSTDPACGDFHWDPAPVDQPAVIEFDVSEAPAVGVPVTVRVIVTDPDGPVSTNCGSYFWGDPFSTEPQIGYGCAVVSCPADSTPYGPWTPPEPSPGHYEETFTHTFTATGTFTFQWTSGYDSTCPPGNPYQQPASATATIPVA